MSQGGGYQICSCPQTIYSTINSVIRDHNSNTLHVTALLRCWKRGCHNPSFCTYRMFYQLLIGALSPNVVFDDKYIVVVIKFVICGAILLKSWTGHHQDGLHFWNSGFPFSRINNLLKVSVICNEIIAERPQLLAANMRRTPSGHYLN